jgi:hypothetical protein
MDLRDRWIRLATLVVAVAALAGCKPQIGDSCSVSTDCSSVGDRLCDTTQPGGYCTIFNCEPGTCPDEAICIAFQTNTSAVCPDPQAGSRLRRTFCLRNCEGDGDCRGGYSCVDLGKDNPWGAGVVEGAPSNTRVCIVPYSGAPLPEEPNTEVCTGTDAGFDAWTPWQPDAASSQADGGADAGADAAGDAASDAAADAEAGADASPSDAAAD